MNTKHSTRPDPGACDDERRYVAGDHGESTWTGLIGVDTCRSNMPRLVVRANIKIFDRPLGDDRPSYWGSVEQVSDDIDATRIADAILAPIMAVA